MRVDWTRFRADDAVISAVLLDPHTRRVRRGVPISRDGSSLMRSEDNDLVETGTLVLSGDEWDGSSLVRIEMAYGGEREPMGTFFARSRSCVGRGTGTQQTLDLKGMLKAASTANLGHPHAFDTGRSTLDAIESVLAGENLRLVRQGAADALHESTAYYEAILKVMDLIKDEAAIGGNRLTTDAEGNVVVYRDVAADRRPVAMRWDADGGDPMLIGEVERGGSDDDPPNSATVQATNDEDTIVANAELPSTDSRSFGRKGIHVGVSVEERNLDPFGPAEAQRLAVDTLNSGGESEERRELQSRYVPLRERDAVMLRENGEWRRWSVKEVEVDLATLDMRVHLIGVQ